MQGVTEVFSFNLEKSKVMLALGDRDGEVRSWRWERWGRDGCGTGGRGLDPLLPPLAGSFPISALQFTTHCFLLCQNQGGSLLN